MSNLTGKLYPVAGFLLWVFIVSCNDTRQSDDPVNKTADSPSVLIQDTVTIKKNTTELHPVKDTIFAGNSDTSVTLKNNEAFIIGRIAANKKQPKYTIPAKKGQTVTALIKPLKKGGNVRINQIRQPNGAFDGPFGDSLSYTFRKSGNLIFIIGENLMAGDPYTGDFLLQVRLSD